MTIEDGRQVWRNKQGQLHRLDGPAIEAEAGGRKEWYVNGQRHRLDGPAYEYGDTTEWYANGKLHRLDGPARQLGLSSWNVPPHDRQQYFVDGHQMTKKEFNGRFFRASLNTYLAITETFEALTGCPVTHYRNTSPPSSQKPASPKPPSPPKL